MMWKLGIVLMVVCVVLCAVVFFFQAEDGIRDLTVTGVQTCALPISDGGGDCGVDGAAAIAGDGDGHGVVAAMRVGVRAEDVEATAGGAADRADAGVADRKSVV